MKFKAGDIVMHKDHAHHVSRIESKRYIMKLIDTEFMEHMQYLGKIESMYSSIIDAFYIKMKPIIQYNKYWAKLNE